MANNGINLYGTASDNLSNPSLADWAQYVAKAAAAVAIKTSTYSITDLDRTISCSGTFSATLPSASTVTGREFTVRNVGTGTVTVTRNADETIDGAATNIAIPSYGAITVISNGTSWLVVNGLYTDTSNYSFIWDNKTAAFVRIIRPTDTNVSLSGNLTVSGTVSLPNGTVTSNMILDGTIVDADINNSASISQSKINNLTSDLASKAPINSPTFTGIVTLPTNVYGWSTNLLDMNVAADQSSTTGFSALNFVTIASSTDYALIGSNSLKATLTSDIFPWVGFGAGSTAFSTNSGSIPVTPGQAYTVVASVYAPAMTIGMRIKIYWWTSAGNVAASTASVNGSTVALSAAWVERRLTAVAPSNAAYASVIVEGTSAGSTSDVFYIDKVGFWEGAGGVWASPGRPINSIGTYTDETVGRRIFTWDTINARWQMTYGDTGWRDMSSLLQTGWTAATGNGESRTLVRRVGNVVHVQSVVAAPSSWSNVNSTFLVLGSGWLRNGGSGFLSTGVIACGNAHTQPLHRIQVLTDGTGLYAIPMDGATYTTNANIRFSAVFSAADTWPSSLPGSAVGSIP